MANQKTSGVISNLVNGVSQQSPALRLPTQAEKQENYYPTIVEGLKDRPPTEFVAKLLSSATDGVFTHIINRDVDERYVMTWDGTNLKVFDFDGVEKTVSGATTYLSTTGTPATQLEALTIHDYTFIINKEKVVAQGTTTAPTRPHEALINIAQGAEGRKYGVIINGQEISLVSGATGVGEGDAVFIAAQLVTALTGPGPGFDLGIWSFTQISSSIYVTNNSADFTISPIDGLSGNGCIVVKDHTQHFSDLPAQAPDGFIAEVIGDDSTQFDNYWVKADTDTSGTTVWRETVKPGLTLDLDNTTMPHTLVRESDGTFTFGPQTWDQRKCGDDDISPMPSFVGSTFNSIFFHKDRLGFLSGENAILSRSGSFFDFFRTSATAVLDDDPLDVSSAHDKVSILRHAVAYQRQLLVFSDQTQFLLAGNGDDLTPKTVSMEPLTEYVSDRAVAPVGIGTSVFFSAARGAWSAIWEYVINATNVGPVGDAGEVTDNVPHYIPAGVFKLAGTSNESVLVALTSGDPTALFIYRFYYDGQKKLQSAWSRWSFPGVTNILNAEFINSELYLVMQRADGVYLEKMQIQPAVTDTDMDFMIHLDQRIHSSVLSAPTYVSDQDVTLYAFPYGVSASANAVTDASDESVPTALQLDVVSSADTTITLKGDTRGYGIWFGNPYERRYRFSQFFVRQQNGAGGSITIESGRLQLLYLTLAYNKTAYFTVEVTPEGRATRTYVFTGRTLGDLNDLLGVIPIASGKKDIPILTRSDRVTIDIVSDSWMPSSFSNAIWYGKHNPNSKGF